MGQSTLSTGNGGMSVEGGGKEYIKHLSLVSIPVSEVTINTCPAHPSSDHPFLSPACPLSRLSREFCGLEYPSGQSGQRPVHLLVASLLAQQGTCRVLGEDKACSAAAKPSSCYPQHSQPESKLDAEPLLGRKEPYPSQIQSSRSTPLSGEILIYLTLILPTSPLLPPPRSSWGLVHHSGDG